MQASMVLDPTSTHAINIISRFPLTPVVVVIQSGAGTSSHATGCSLWVVILAPPAWARPRSARYW